MEFQFVFAKEDFDILPEHCKWDRAEGGKRNY